VPTNALVFGPMIGALQDSGESLALERPDTPQTNGVVPYIVVDEVRYNDKSPWPASADGAGDSLHRLAFDAYANDPTNWTAAAPTPGSLSAVNPDRDGDGLPNDWELAHELNPDDPSDAALDSDGDGLSNAQEYLAGTDPQFADSALRLTITHSVSGMRLSFNAVAGHSYTVQANGTLGTTGWTNVFTFPAPSVSQAAEWQDTNTLTQRFYRLITPGQNP
jgi:hypothetical protein